MSDYSGWLGREQRAAEDLTHAAARRWLASFDLPEPAGRALPQGLHWTLCQPCEPTAHLGGDGHALRDGDPASFLPPVPRARRMWAASAVDFIAPIEVSRLVERTSRISTIEDKHGRSGPMTFVTVLHEYRADGVAVLTERQTLVYRDRPLPGGPAEPVPGVHPPSQESEWDMVRRIVPAMPLLSRYSALTFNSHRIHYDADYCREIEGYRGVVVHAPLIASLLLQLAAKALGGDNRLTRFAIRGLSPAIAGEELVLALRELAPGTLAMAAFAADGRPVSVASAAYPAG